MAEEWNCGRSTGSLQAYGGRPHRGAAPGPIPGPPDEPAFAATVERPSPLTPALDAGKIAIDDGAVGSLGSWFGGGLLMSAEKCPSCEGRGDAWTVDDEGRTNRCCALCGYAAEEHDSPLGRCKSCGQDGAIRLAHDGDAYSWCVLCGASHEPTSVAPPRRPRAVRSLLPRFRIQTLMIAVAVLAVYGAILRDNTVAGIGVLLFTARPLLRVAQHRASRRRYDAPTSAVTTCLVFAEAFCINSLQVSAVLLPALVIIPVLIQIISPCSYHLTE